VEELVSDVCEDRGAARRDSAFGDKFEKPGEKLVDVDADVELRKFRQEFGGEVFRVVLNVHWEDSRSDCLGMAETKAGVSRQAWEAAALAVGIKIRTARGSALRRDYDRITDGAGANDCCAHELFLFLVGGTHPHSMHECENKRVAKWAPRKCMKRKRGFFLR